MHAHLVVDVAVGEHGVEVLDALTGAAVVVVLQALLDGSHVHGLLDDLVIVLEQRARRYPNRSRPITCVMQTPTYKRSAKTQRVSTETWLLNPKADPSLNVVLRIQER